MSILLDMGVSSERFWMVSYVLFLGLLLEQLQLSILFSSS